MPSFRTRAAQPEELLPVRRGLERRAGAALPEWDAFAATAQLCSGAPGKLLSPATKDASGGPGIHLVTSGVLKATVTTSAGRLRIMSFPRTGDIVASLGFLAAASQTTIPVSHDPGEPLPGDAKLTAVVATTTLRFDGAVAIALAERHRAWSTLALRLLMELLLLRTFRLNDHLVLSAEERYLKVLREEAALVRQISQRDLALYLGITPEALSRIAARARERQRLQPAGE